MHGSTEIQTGQRTQPVFVLAFSSYNYVNLPFYFDCVDIGLGHIETYKRQ